jgi:hypothetical protein
MESSSVGKADGGLHHFEQFDFNKGGIAGFQIQIGQAIDCKVDKFAVCVSQQGQRLNNFRSKVY